MKNARVTTNLSLRRRIPRSSLTKANSLNSNRRKLLKMKTRSLARSKTTTRTERESPRLRMRRPL
jgi:hypothetical protein